jgi:hypothetical protein
LVKYGILWKFHAKVIEVNVDRICGCVTNSINLIGGFNHPIKKKTETYLSVVYTRRAVRHSQHTVTETAGVKETTLTLESAD